MGKAKLAILIILAVILSLSTIGRGANEGSVELGVEFGFAGGPIILLTGSVGLVDQVQLVVTAGGFTDLTRGIFRGKVDLRYTFLKSKFSPYMQGGLGYFYLHKIEKFSYNHLRETHLRGGVEYSFTESFTGRGDLGLLWAPPLVNPKVEEQFPDTPLVVPLANLGGVFSLPVE